MISNLEKIISFNRNGVANSFFLSASKKEILKKFSSIEIAFTLYPYSKEINANNFSILPYEEYVEDVSQNTRSNYTKADEYGSKIFGILLSLIIIFVFWRIDKNLLASVEAIVSIIGAYAVGKELWQDIDKTLVNLSKNSKLRWLSLSYYYTKQDFGTIQQFWRRARVKRMGLNTLLASQMDFITHSNSKTIELYFSKSDLGRLNDTTGLLLDIEVENSKVKEFVDKKFMVSFKIILSKNLFFFKQNIEIFQAIDSNSLGTIDGKGNWIENASLVRKTFSIGRLKFYMKEHIAGDLQIISK